MTQAELEGFLRKLRPDEERRLRLLQAGKDEAPSEAGDERWPRPVPGECYRLPRSLFMQEGQSFAVYQNDRYGATGMHTHDFIEIAWVCAGRCNMVIEGQAYRLEAGDLCILNTNAVHSIGYAGEEDILVNLLLAPDYIDMNFLELLDSNPLFTDFFLRTVYQNDQAHRFLLFRPGRDSEVSETICQILREYFDQDGSSQRILAELLLVLFHRLLRVSRRTPDLVVSAGSGETGPALPLFEYLDRHYTDLTLEDLAAKFGYSPGYVSALLRKSYGKSFSEIRQELRLRHAAAALRQTSQPVAEIAAQYGYHNLTFFYRQFAAEFGMTPKQYRTAQLAL